MRLTIITICAFFIFIGIAEICGRLKSIDNNIENILIQNRSIEK